MVRGSRFEVRRSKFEPRSSTVRRSRFCRFEGGEASQVLRLFWASRSRSGTNRGGISRAPRRDMGKGAKNFEELRVWRAASEFKKEVYRLVDSSSFRREGRLRDQLREAAASAVSHISEGYARFEPGDQARFMRMAKASLVECQNHLIDAVDRGVITEEVRKKHDGRVESVLRQIGPFIVYLQSPQAKRNAERIKRQRASRRRKGDASEP